MKTGRTQGFKHNSWVFIGTHEGLGRVKVLYWDFQKEHVILQAQYQSQVYTQEKTGENKQNNNLQT